MDRRRLILHIGLQKTGTSSIQLMLSGSSDILESGGYFYPNLPNPQTPLWRSAFRHNIVASTYADYRSAFDKLTNEDENIFWKAIHASELSPILSAEDFSRQRSFRAMSKHLHGLDVHPVVYLRRQDLFAESLYNQRNKLLLLRGSRALLDPDLLSEESLFRFIAQEDYTHVLNFKRLVSALEDHLAPKALTVRPFVHGQLVDGDVCKDFAHVIGLAPDRMVFPRSYANESVGNAVFAEIISTLTSQGEDAAFARMQEVKAQMESGHNLSGSYRILTAGTRNNLLKQYADINQWVERRYDVTLC